MSDQPYADVRCTSDDYGLVVDLLSFLADACVWSIQAMSNQRNPTGKALLSEAWGSAVSAIVVVISSTSGTERVDSRNASGSFPLLESRLRRACRLLRAAIYPMCMLEPFILDVGVHHTNFPAVPHRILGYLYAATVVGPRAWIVKCDRLHTLLGLIHGLQETSHRDFTNVDVDLQLVSWRWHKPVGTR